jgi:GDP-L-fucose synthase
MAKTIILLTGGNGFIGKNIKESYLSKKYEILAPNSSELNLLDESSVAKFFDLNKVEIVIHSATKRCNRESYNKEDILSSNLKMFFNLESHKNRYKKILNLGSGAVYDLRQSMVKITEQSFGKHIPIDMYGFSKYVISKYIEDESKFYDLRIFGIFGKYEDFTMRLISNLICKSLLNKPLTINQNRIFDYLYIDDLFHILDFFIENDSDNTAFNLTQDNSISFVEIAEKIQQFTSNKLPINIKQEGLGLEYTGNNSRLKEFFPNIEFTTIDKAIQELWNWYSQNKEMLQPFEYNL